LEELQHLVKAMLALEVVGLSSLAARLLLVEVAEQQALHQQKLAVQPLLHFLLGRLLLAQA
jgi:hypothetical protein